MSYSDINNFNPGLSYAKPIKVFNGGSKYLDAPSYSAAYKKRPYQYTDLQFNSGNVNSQTEIDSRRRSQSKGQSGGRVDGRYYINEYPSTNVNSYLWAK